ncbi:MULTISPECIES: hypothetical protein [unclassified Nocardiopsis]|uniref:hypothetical protein n=1 Tax=unclassified Nocardiopsis TaxID=2649073 RepID=UPI00135A3A01|nr:MULTISPECIES: hypothetical protein [unclassified Nocardiopsis]
MPKRSPAAGGRTGGHDPLARLKGLARSAGQSKGRNPLSRAARRPSPSGRGAGARRNPLHWLDSLTRPRKPRL